VTGRTRWSPEDVVIFALTIIVGLFLLGLIAMGIIAVVTGVGL
jgi:hypothetical protein